jgi:hypothetical protein
MEIKLTASFNLGSDIVVKKESSAILPKGIFTELKPH